MDSIFNRRLQVLTQHISQQPLLTGASLLEANETKGQIKPAPVVEGTYAKLVGINTDAHINNQSSHILNPGPNKALEDERKNATFDVREMTYFLDGGKDFTTQKEKFMQALERDEAFQYTDRYDMTTPETRINTFKKIARFYEIMNSALKPFEHNPTLQHLIAYDLITLSGVADPNFYTRFGIHNSLFKTTVKTHGHDSLVKKIVPLAETLQIYGCFAMTEMGTGSFVRGLETTAIFDPSSDSFTIHSPTTTSRKFWIGGAGQTSTHATVFARLLLPTGKTENNATVYKDYGVHIFLVQLRDLSNHQPMPGVQLGDIGAKMGRNGIDNGWIVFNHVKIPRDQMLMKWAQVTRDGQYIPSPLPQLQYSALVEGRVSIVLSSSAELMRACTIATRYGCIRRQFVQKGKPEPYKIMDYQTHQYRLLPLIAGCYAIHFAGRSLIKEADYVLNECLMKQKKVLDVELADLHNLSAGFKACTSWFALEGMETARQTLGGHGYSAYAGIAQLIQDFAVNCTWEGDNTVLCQQLSSYLVKSVQKVFANGNKPCLKGKSIQYLNNYYSTLQSKCKAQTEDDFLSTNVQLEMYRYRACKLITNTALRMQVEYKKQGKMSFEVFNSCQVELVKCAKVHSYLCLVESFIETVNNPSSADPLPGRPNGSMPSISEGTNYALKKLSDIFALYYIEQDMSVFLAEGYLTSDQSKMISAALRKVMKAARTDAVAYVDAYNYSDYLVNSPLGAYDGDIYKKYMERIRKHPYYQTRADYYQELIQPVINPNADVTGFELPNK